MVSGIRNTMIGLAAAAALVGMADPKDLARSREIAIDPDRDTELARRRRQQAHEERAWERKQRRKRDDEMREQRLRQRIATGKDDRADKYLHSAARRRRAAERSTTTPEA